MMPRVKDNRRLMKTLDDWLAHCGQLHPKTIDMGLDNVRAVAERMGLRFDCPVFTVAGTNGKGSTCAMLEAILTQAGFAPGCSPRRTWCGLKNAAGFAARTSMLLIW